MKKKHYGYSILVLCIILYITIQAFHDYNSRKASKIGTQAQLENNLTSLKEHSLLDSSTEEYDKKYNGTLSKWPSTQSDTVFSSEEPFWTFNSIIKYFIYPLLALVLGSWILKKLRIL